MVDFNQKKNMEKRRRLSKFVSLLTYTQKIRGKYFLMLNERGGEIRRGLILTTFWFHAIPFPYTTTSPYLRSQQ